MSDQAKVFLSHSSDDKVLARRLAKDLGEAGFDVWLDQWVIGVGDEIEELVERGVDEADVVIVLLTAASVKSNWVEREWRRKFEQETRRQRVALIPVRGESCEIPDFLAQRSHADIIGGSYPLGLRHLIDLLRHYTGSPPVQTASDRQAVDDADMPQLVPLVYRVAVEIGAGLIPSFEGAAGRRILGERLPAQGEALKNELGFQFPPVHSRGNATDMLPFAAVILFDEIPELSLQMPEQQVVAEAGADALARIGISGTPCVESAFSHWSWIDRGHEGAVRHAGVSVLEPVDYLLAILQALMAANAAMFIDIDTAMSLVADATTKSGTGATPGLPTAVSWSDLTEVLQLLVAERISIAALPIILSAIAQHTDELPDVIALTEFARHGLRDQISRCLSPHGEPLNVISLHSSIEQKMRDAIKLTEAGPYFDLAPEVTQQISAAVRERLSVPDCADAAAIIIVDDFRIRRYLRRLIELEFPLTPVYSRSDLNPSIPLQALGQIRVAGGLKE